MTVHDLIKALVKMPDGAVPTVVDSTIRSVVKLADGKVLFVPTQPLRAQPVTYFRCPQCGRTMKTRSGLLIHYSRMHHRRLRWIDVKGV
jgi:hypothetical protein